MKKPKYLEELLKILFFWLGIAFVCAAILSYTGILQPKSNSLIQDPVMIGCLFLVIGLTFASASAILGMAAAKKEKQHSQLLANGTKITGIAEKVYQQKSIQYGNQSPYQIKYAYTYLDRTYHRKSCFLWQKPNLAAGDPITVYTDDFGKSTILF